MSGTQETVDEGNCLKKWNPHLLISDPQNLLFPHLRISPQFVVYFLSHLPPIVCFQGANSSNNHLFLNSISRYLWYSKPFVF